MAILTIRGFWIPNFEDFKRFLQDSFRKMEKSTVGNLIIDIRGNRGGHPFFTAELLSYVSSSEFIYFELPIEQGEFAPLYHPIQSQRNASIEKVYLIIDGGCMSSAGHFISLVKYHKMATIIGEESGGSFYCNDNSIQLKLPNTGIMLNLARTTFQTKVSGFKKGDPLIPDYLIKPTLQDILHNTDKAMNFTLSLIKKNSEPMH